jgi:hypothetical protein
MFISYYNVILFDVIETEEGFVLVPSPVSIEGKSQQSIKELEASGSCVTSTILSGLHISDLYIQQKQKGTQCSTFVFHRSTLKRRHF